VIDQLNGHKILDGSALQVAVSQDQPGQTIELGILRNGTPMALSVKVGEYHKPGAEVAEIGSGASSGGNTGRLGLRSDDLDSGRVSS